MKPEGVHQTMQTVLVDIALDLVNTTQMIVTGLHADPCLGVETEFTVQLNA